LLGKLAVIALRRRTLFFTITHITVCILFCVLTQSFACDVHVVSWNLNATEKLFYGSMHYLCQKCKKKMLIKEENVEFQNEM